MNGLRQGQDDLGEAVLALAHEVARGCSMVSSADVDELTSEILLYVWPLVLDHVTGRKPRFCLQGEPRRFSAEMVLRLMKRKAHFALLDLRRERLTAMEQAKVDPDSQPAPVDALENALELMALEAVLRSLNPLDRLVSKLLAAGHSSNEVGKMLNLSSHAVRNRQCRQHKRFRETGMIAFFT
jgi:DNA-directed RNA polymerase specialized sigma24 family protein